MRQAPSEAGKRKCIITHHTKPHFLWPLRNKYRVSYNQSRTCHKKTINPFAETTHTALPGGTSSRHPAVSVAKPSYLCRVACTAATASRPSLALPPPPPPPPNPRCPIFVVSFGLRGFQTRRHRISRRTRILPLPRSRRCCLRYRRGAPARIPASPRRWQAASAAASRRPSSFDRAFPYFRVVIFSTAAVVFVGGGGDSEPALRLKRRRVAQEGRSEQEGHFRVQVLNIAIGQKLRERCHVELTRRL